MAPKKLSRRNALGMIAKTGAAVGAAAYLFLGHKISPLAGSSSGALGPSGVDPQTGLRGTAQNPREKSTDIKPKGRVAISQLGTTILVKISEQPGRYFVAAYATTDAVDRYKPIPNSIGLIGPNSLGTFKIDAKVLPDGKVFLRVVTSARVLPRAKSKYNEGFLGTEPFIVRVANGEIAKIFGPMNLPLVGDGEKTAIAVSCFSQKGR